MRERQRRELIERGVRSFKAKRECRDPGAAQTLRHYCNGMEDVLAVLLTHHELEQVKLGIDPDKEDK